MHVTTRDARIRRGSCARCASGRHHAVDALQILEIGEVDRRHAPLRRHLHATRVSRWSASRFSSSSRPGGRSRVARGQPRAVDRVGAGTGGRARPARRRRRDAVRRRRRPLRPCAPTSPRRRRRGPVAPGAPVRRPEQRSGVAGRQLAVGEQMLHRRGKAEQTHAVGDRRAALADPGRHLIVGELEVLDQLLVRSRLLERREILPVQVLDECLLDRARSSVVRMTAGIVARPARCARANAARRRSVRSSRRRSAGRGSVAAPPSRRSTPTVR